MSIPAWSAYCQTHLGASWSYLNHSLTPFGSDVDRIRISVIKQLLWSLGGFLLKHRSYSNQREHSCQYPLDWHRHSHWGLTDRIRILAQPLWNGSLIVFESETLEFCSSYFTSANIRYLVTLLKIQWNTLQSSRINVSYIRLLRTRWTYMCQFSGVKFTLRGWFI